MSCEISVACVATVSVGFCTFTETLATWAMKFAALILLSRSDYHAEKCGNGTLRRNLSAVNATEQNFPEELQLYSALKFGYNFGVCG